jgi:hypothetical protein
MMRAGRADQPHGTGRRCATVRVAWALAASLLVLASLSARAADPPAGAPPAAAAIDDAKAKALAAEFDRAIHLSASKEWEVRRDAVASIAETDHPILADRLLALSKDDADARVRASAFAALGAQTRSKAKVGAALEARLERIARPRADQRRGGLAPVPLDDKGEPRSDDASKRAVELRHDESAEAAAALRSLRRLDVRPADSGAAFLELLLDGSDDVVVVLLDAYGAWKSGFALREVHDLFRLYPGDNAWEGKGVVTLSGDDCRVNPAYRARYGDPERRRARPRVLAAVRTYIRAVTGEELADAAALAAWIKAHPKASAGGAGR